MLCTLDTVVKNDCKMSHFILNSEQSEQSYCFKRYLNSRAKNQKREKGKMIFGAKIQINSNQENFTFGAKIQINENQ